MPWIPMVLTLVLYSWLSDSVTQADPQTPDDSQSKCVLIYPPAYPTGASDSTHLKEDLCSPPWPAYLSFISKGIIFPAIPEFTVNSFFFLIHLVWFLPGPGASSFLPHLPPPSHPPPHAIVKSLISCTWATCRTACLIFLILCLSSVHFQDWYL